MVSRSTLHAACLAAAACAALASGQATMLRQADFDAGTVIIDRPGLYQLAEDIVFRPRGDLAKSEPELWMFPDVSETPYSASPFRLGFFAAVVIAADDVTFDLGGFTLSQSKEHALMQRFFALIEISNSPFPPAKGPADFVREGFVASNRVIIRHGKLGRSAHHGIHGNGNTDVLLWNLDISDFEVAGISLNQVTNLHVFDVAVHDSRTDVPAFGSLSQAIFLLQAVSKHLNLDPAFGGAAIAAAQTKLRSLLADFLDKGAAASREAVALFGSRAGGLPDASLLAGVMIHPTVNVGGMTEAVPSPGSAESASVVVLDGLEIFNLRASPGETGTLFPTDADAAASNGYVNSVHTHDIVGAVFEVDNVVQGEAYAGDALTDLQLAIAKYALACLAEGSGCTSAANPAEAALLRRSTITAEVVDWSEGKTTWTELLQGGYKVVGNHDVMFHKVKGVIGLKLDGTNVARVRNVLVYNIANAADVSRRSPLVPPVSVYDGYLARGVTVSGSSDVRGLDISTAGISSAQEATTCIDVRNDFVGVSFHRIAQTRTIADLQASGAFRAPAANKDPQFVTRDTVVDLTSEPGPESAPGDVGVAEADSGLGFAAGVGSGAGGSILLLGTGLLVARQLKRQAPAEVADAPMSFVGSPPTV